MIALEQVEVSASRLSDADVSALAGLYERLSRHPRTPYGVQCWYAELAANLRSVNIWRAHHYSEWELEDVGGI